MINNNNIINFNGLKVLGLDVSANSLNTGVYSGGGLTINVDPTKANILPITFWVVDHSVNPPVYSYKSWDGVEGLTLTNLATSPATDIALQLIGDTVTVIQRAIPASPFTRSELRDFIFLGGLDHSGNTVINNTFSVQIPSYSAGLSIADYARATGDKNINGNVVTPNGANLKLNKSSGSTFSFGRNTVNDPTDPHTIIQDARTAFTFNHIFNNGTGGAVFVASSDTLVTNKYDNGSGTLATVQNNFWSIQRILMFSNTGNIFIQYSTEEFQKKNEAIASLSSSLFKNLSGVRTAIEIGFIVVKNGAIALNDTTQAVFYPSSNGGVIGSQISIVQFSENEAVVLTDTASIDLTSTKHTLTSSSTTRTFTISYTGDDINIELTLSATGTVYTFPATSLCVAEGVASGDNTLTLAGISGDKYIISVKKFGSNYYVVSKNFGQ